MKVTLIFRALCALLLAVLCLAIPVQAQGFKWWQAEQFVRELRLTNEQSKRLEDIFQAAAPKLRALKKALDQAEVELNTLIERGGDHAVMEQVDDVETARKELNTSRTLMLLSMRKVLTADQWAKFTALHQATVREREKARANEQAR